MIPRTALQALVDRGIASDIVPRVAGDDAPSRRSAVLILFGALDDIDAAAAQNSRQSPLDRRLLARVGAELDVLLLRRADGMRHHPGQIAFPGGGIDPEDASVAAAALREAQEETGLDPAGVEVIGTLPEIPLIVSDNMVTPVVAWWSRPSEIAAVDHTEAVQVFRVPVAELLDPASRGTAVLHRETRTFTSPAFRLRNRLGGHIVWGFTAMVLDRLFDELGWSVQWDAEREFSIRPS